LEREAILASIRVLARAVEAKDSATHEHSERVAALAALLAVELGWPAERVSLLREAGRVHDVGKIGVPDAILLNPAASRPTNMRASNSTPPWAPTSSAASSASSR
jgi:HD-GYP domain-containing protein (c-di-GMP phosphodiesterase class II)